MKLEQAHIDQIRTAFEKMQSKVDLLHVLNYAKPLVYGEKAVPFEIKQLTWYANPKLGTKRYVEFKIKKKSGSERSINSPIKGLKALQKTLSFVLQCVYEPHLAAKGFVKGRSIVDNAQLHAGNRYVYNIDLKDFFPSIDQARVWKCLQLKPFNLNKEYSSGLKYMSLDDFLNTYFPGKTSLNFNERIDFFSWYLMFENAQKSGMKISQQSEPLNNIKNGLTFYKSENKRYICKLENAVIYTAINYDRLKPSFIIIANEQIRTKNGVSLNGTYWLVNKIPDINRLNIANILASLCCTEMEVERKNDVGEWEIVLRNVLPQGAPTSPVITNIICQKLDRRLAGVAKRFGLKYSRYADDITFSSLHNVYQPESDFLKELHRIIAEQNFHIKESKTRLQKDGYRKEVTGLLVNEKVNVPQRYIKQLRMWLYYWERYGYDIAESFFLQQYLADKGHIAKGKPNMVNIIAGKLDYLKMVKGVENELYLKLKSRFEILTGKKVGESKKIIKEGQCETKDANLSKKLSVKRAQIEEHSSLKIIENPTPFKANAFHIPVHHKPKELVTLLKKFSINDSALKYTTHSWDAGREANMFKDLSEFLAIALGQYNEFSFALKGLSENLNGKIYNFLFNKEIAKSGWGDLNLKKRIYFGWSSPELLEACRNDISLNPEDFILPEKFQIQRSGKTLQKFKHIIDVFKNEIEVRDENSALLNLILQKHDNYLISFSAPKVTNLENKTFYTDIQWLSKAFDLIFEGIQKYPQHPAVEYAVTENNNDRLVFTILHRNSLKNGLSIYDDKLNLKRGDFSTIKDKLLNLCDWSIESDFSEGSFRINYLVSDINIPAYEEILSAEGFKHILTFYK